MRVSRSLIAGSLTLVLLFLVWGSVVLHASNPHIDSHVLEYQLLTNPGMEVFDPPYGQFEGVDCQVATGWQRFSYDGPEPCFLDTRGFARSDLGGSWVEKIEGNTSQIIISTEPYSAGLWQRITGLTPGMGYGFHAAMLTIYQSSAPPIVNGTMIKQVGFDPTGGTNPQAQTVVWSEPDDRDEAWDVNRRVSLYAQGSESTVFIRVTSPFGAGSWPYMNLSFLDSAILARTTPVAATSPAESESTSFVVRWSHGKPAPGVVRIKWYDIQWMDEAEGTWRDWLTEIDVRDGKIEETFVGERGHTYRFRARVWQKYENGAHLYSPFRAGGDTWTYVRGPELIGRVLSNEGHGAGAATISLLGADNTATTGAGGGYRIGLLPTTQVHTVVVDHPYWDSPAPVHGVTFGPTETVTMNWTLRPPDDAVTNGGFESGLAGWSQVVEQGGAVTVVADPVHTGHAALTLGGQAGASSTAGITQTVALTRSWEPALSFWYQPQSTDPNDEFNVILTTVTETAAAGVVELLDRSSTLAVTETHILTPSLVGNDWRHLWTYPAPVDTYFTGTVTIHFRLHNDGENAATTVHLDEVCLGRTAGGPFKGYSPLVLRGH